MNLAVVPKSHTGTNPDQLPTGAYTVTVKGVSGGVEHTTAITIQIQ